MDYFQLIFVIAFAFALCFLSSKLGRNFALTVDCEKIVIKRKLVTQVLKFSEIDKAIAKGGCLVFYGKFNVVDRSGKESMMRVVELRSNGSFDMIALKGILFKKGVTISEN